MRYLQIFKRLRFLIFFTFLSFTIYSQNLRDTLDLEKEKRHNIEKEADLFWSIEDAKDYNLNQFDESKWNLELLEVDMLDYDDDPWPTKVPIQHVAYPVAKYGPGYQGYAAKGISLSIENKIIDGSTFAVGTNENSIEPRHDPSRSNLVFFNILILTDKPDSENSSSSVSSRNYPHHTCQGRRKTSVGNIDWVAMHLANGVKFAIISTKYFNLEFGQTILVAPQMDGSLRFKQINLPSLSTEEIDGIITKLGAQKDVFDFFTRSTNI